MGSSRLAQASAAVRVREEECAMGRRSREKVRSNHLIPYSEKRA